MSGSKDGSVIAWDTRQGDASACVKKHSVGGCITSLSLSYPSQPSSGDGDAEDKTRSGIRSTSGSRSRQQFSVAATDGSLSLMSLSWDAGADRERVSGDREAGSGFAEAEFSTQFETKKCFGDGDEK